ncbi:DUF309 domain-containing protein [Halobaculum sp. P14]|uniref:DUF309 domain-containing protein n=1 Tax=Halobaculum sp. P14 TaxID=3421638 RepID=UPI003EBFB544
MAVDDDTAALRAGVALFNAGEYHAAHDPWETAWLALPDDDPDEPLFHGLIQFTAAVHHARGRNWTGAVGLAAGARDYLGPLPDRHRGVDVAAVRAAVRALEADPERVERAPTAPLTHDGDELGYADLSLQAAAAAADAVAAEYGYDDDVVADAARYAELESERGRSRFAALLFDFLTEEAGRGFIHGRLTDLVAQRRRKEEDVTGLFD